MLICIPGINPVIIPKLMIYIKLLLDFIGAIMYTKLKYMYIMMNVHEKGGYGGIQ